MRFELLPLIEAIAAMSPRPKLVTSVRDILQERAKPGRNEETVDLVNAHFDLVMVHGDPAFARIEETFPEAAGDHQAGSAIPASSRRRPPPPAAERFDVLISAGGGAAGRTSCARRSTRALILAPIGRWGLITGPNLPAEARRGGRGARAGGRGDLPLPAGLRQPAERRDAVGLAGGLQHGLRYPAGRLPLACWCPSRPAARPNSRSRAERLARLGLATSWPRTG